MGDISILRARLRKRDKDILQAVRRLELEEGEMADMVRDGFRRELTERMRSSRQPVEPITPDAAKLIAQELVRNLKAERSRS